jgi:hypothetical protein
VSRRHPQRTALDAGTETNHPSEARLPGDGYIRGRAPFARPILTHLRTVIHDAHPALEESIRWGMPAFLYRGKIVCGLGAFKSHCALWFRDGNAVVGAKPAAGMGQFGRITSLEDLPPDAGIAGYVRKAIARIEGKTS